MRSLSDRPTCNSINKVQLIRVGHATNRFYTFEAPIYIESMDVTKVVVCKLFFPFGKVYNRSILDKIRIKI